MAHQVRTLGIPSGTLCVRGQGPDFWVNRSIPRVQMSTSSVPGWLGWFVDFDIDQVWPKGILGHLSNIWDWSLFGV